MKKQTFDSMKALVWGGGSIGTRHATNLRTLGLSKIDILESHLERAAELTRLGFNVIQSTPKSVSYDFAIVATPTHLHGEHATQILSRGVPLFVEKPLAHDWKALKAITTAHTKQPVVSLVGCNMRFHPGPKCVKTQLQSGVIGNPIFGRVHTGSFLPEWRPNMDYRKSYSAIASQGGGVLLDCIHEIDLAAWYFGDFEEVFSYADKLSGLEIDTEDFAVLVSKHASGTLSEIHLDYFQRAYSRGCHIAGTEGTITWEFERPCVRVFESKTKTWREIDLPKDWQMNDMYVDEMRHFLNCVIGTEQPTLDIPSAVAITEVAIHSREQNKIQLKRKAA